MKKINFLLGIDIFVIIVCLESLIRKFDMSTFMFPVVIIILRIVSIGILLKIRRDVNNR